MLVGMQSRKSQQEGLSDMATIKRTLENYFVTFSLYNFCRFINYKKNATIDVSLLVAL